MKKILSIFTVLFTVLTFGQNVDPYLQKNSSSLSGQWNQGTLQVDYDFVLPTTLNSFTNPDLRDYGKLRYDTTDSIPEYYNGEEWRSLETTSNKASDLLSPDNITYPTTEAVYEAIDRLNILSGSEWVIYGDSFSADPVDDYPAIVAEKLKLNRTIYAVSGATIATQLTVAEGQVSGNADFFDDFDVATIHIGINDFASGTTLGNVNSTVGGGTFAGKLRRFIELIQTSNPLIKIWVMTPPEAQNMYVTYKGTNSAGYTLEQMATVISQVCNYYSIQCIDLYNISGINLKTLAQLTSDGLHPSVPLGINRLGNIVADAMLSNCSQGKNNKNLIGTANTIPRFDNYGGLQGNLNLYHLSGKTGNFHTPTAYGHWVSGESGIITAGSFGNRVALLAGGTTGLYGLAFGSLSDGSSWSQVARSDGDTTLYDWFIQPLGGNVILGGTTDNGEKLQVNGNSRLNGSVSLPTEPTTSAGTYAILTWNSSTGIIEKISSSTIPVILTGTATLDFGSTSAGTSSELTISVTGATPGDAVFLGVPSSANQSNSCYTAVVTTADTVDVRFNNYSSGPIDPGSGTFTAKIIK